MGKEQKQVGVLIDPNEPGKDRYPYYLLEKMHSPPIAPEHAIRWEAYDEPKRFLRQDDPNDNRVAQGFIIYDRPLSWLDLYKYNLLPMNYDESILFDLWIAFDQDKARLLGYLGLFFRVAKGDPALRRLSLAIKMIGRELTLRRAKKILDGGAGDDKT
jgi:hypothetical protein